MSKKLYIIHPCYNPKPGWENVLLLRYAELVKQLPSDLKVKMLLVNDGSSDSLLIEKMNQLKLNLPDLICIHTSLNSGKGFALRLAMNEAQEGFIIYTDIDYPFRTESMVEIYHLLQNDGYDVVVGLRTKEYFCQQPYSRRILSFVLRVANYVFFPRIFIKDTQSGLKGYNQKGREVFLKTKINGFLFEPEFFRLCGKYQLKMKSVDLKLSDGLRFSPIEWKVLRRELFNYLKLMI